MRVAYTSPDLPTATSLQIGLAALLEATPDQHQCALVIEATKDLGGYITLGDAHVSALRNNGYTRLNGRFLHLLTPWLRKQTFQQGPGLIPFCSPSRLFGYLSDRRFTGTV